MLILLQEQLFSIQAIYTKLNVPLSGHRLKRKELDQSTYYLVLIYLNFLSN